MNRAKPGEARTWWKPGDLELLVRIKLARQKNIEVYKRLAELLPEAERAGWRPREPGAPDVTMLIVERSMRRSVSETKAALREICENDDEVMRLTRKLAE